MEGGIEPERVGELTFKEIDWIMQRRASEIEHDWRQTRVIWNALTGKNPINLIRLSTDPPEKEWTQEDAINTLKRYGEWQK